MEIDLIQVGAHVGKDHVRELFDSGRARSGLIIEPLPHLFRQLKRNYRDMPGAILVNAAIASEPGTQTMYYADPKPGDPDWTDQLGSFSREQVEKHANMMSGGAIDIREKPVKCLDWKTLLEKYDVRRCEKLFIDAEGYDWFLVVSFPFNLFRPRSIMFEYFHLSPAQHACTMGRLRENGYSVEMLDGMNSIATL